MKQEILNWLAEGQPYEQGVELYAKYGPSSTVLKNFNRKENDMRKAKLAYKLVVKIANLPEKYITMDPEKLPKIQNKIQTHSSHQTTQSPGPNTTNQPNGKSQEQKAEEGWKGKIPWKDLPKEIKLLIVDRGELVKKRIDAHERLKAVSEANTPENVEKRKAIVDEMDALQQEITAIHYKVNYYEENLKLPTKFEEAKNETDLILELTKKYNNLKSQRSKYRNKVYGNPDKNKDPLPDGPKKEAAKEKLAKIEDEIKDVEKKLGR